MWNPIKIQFRNLFAHLNSEYIFQNNKCVVIFGENRTDKNFENNGAGKTTLFEAICLALTGESLRNLKKEEFINYNAKSCEVRFILDNPVMKMKLEIVRTFYQSHSSKVEIYENGELNNQIVSVNDANKRVFELIGIGREDLLRYFIIGQDNHYTFFTAGDVEKKEVINRITNANMIVPVMEKIDGRMKELNEAFCEYEDKKTAYKSRIETLEEQITELEENDDDCGDLNDIKVEIEKTRLALNIVNSELKKIKIVDTKELRGKLKTIRNEIEELVEKVDDNNSLKRRISSEIDREVVCPECGKTIIPDSDLNLNPKTAKKALEKVEKELEIQEDELGKLRKRKKELVNAIEEGDEVEVRYNQKKRKQDDLQHKLERLNGELKELESKDSKIQINKLKDKLKKTENEFNELELTIKPITDEIEMLKFWKFSMGKNGFSTYLANKSVKVIEGVTNNFLQKFGVEIRVIINGFKINNKGELKEKIEVFIDDGIKERSFMARSGGERGRVTLAGVLGIHHLINLSLGGKGLNLLLLDENLNNVDSLGVESIIKIFEKIGITILVISQNITDEFQNENSLYVVKENGVAKYLK